MRLVRLIEVPTRRVVYVNPTHVVCVEDHVDTGSTVYLTRPKEALRVEGDVHTVVEKLTAHKREEELD